MTKIDIIKETKEFYAADPLRRAVDHQSCYYKKDDKMCAVGRCIIPEKNYDLENSFMFIKHRNGDHLTKEEQENLFKPEYHGHEPDFWHALQQFHDQSEYWDTKGLTKFGQKQYEYLLDLYSVFG